MQRSISFLRDCLVRANCSIDCFSASIGQEFVPLINDLEVTSAALAAAVFKPEAISGECDPYTASEDFARFLDYVPGCFAFIGNGEDSAPLHNPAFDFNDDALLYGMRFHTAIARHRLPA